MKNFLLIPLFIFFTFQLCFGQPQTKADSLKTLLQSNIADSIKVKLFYQLSDTNIPTDEQLNYVNQGLLLAKKINHSLGVLEGMFKLSFKNSVIGNWAKGLEIAYEGIEETKKRKMTDYELSFFSMVAMSYQKQKDFKNVLLWSKRILQGLDAGKYTDMGTNEWAGSMHVSEAYVNLNKPDSALYYANRSYQAAVRNKLPEYMTGYTLQEIGNVLAKQKKYNEAYAAFLKSMNFLRNDMFSVNEVQIDVAKMYLAKNDLINAEKYALLAFNGTNDFPNPNVRLEASEILAKLYEPKSPSKAYPFLKIFQVLKDSIFSRNKYNQIYQLESNQKRKIARERQLAKDAENKAKENIYLIVLGFLLLTAGGLGYSSIQKKKANRQLQQQKDKVDTTLADLKITQSQLEHKNRDLEIEAALEKIRSRSLAMHYSIELKEVMSVMFENMKELGVVRDGGIGIHLFKEGLKSSDLWVVNHLNEPQCISLPYNEMIFSGDSYVTQMFNAKAAGSDIFNNTQLFEAKNKYFDYVFANNNFDVIPSFVRDFIKSAPSHTFSMAIEKNSSVVVDSWNETLMTETEFEVLKRLARVFEQAYIRFLDLQKAEAQAREAQIEAALEKVRSHTMAMQSSNQLREIAAITLQQLQSLGFNYGACSIVIMNAATGDMFWWIQGFEQDYPGGYRFPYFEHPFYLAQLNNWKAGKEYAVMECNGEDKVTYDIYTFNNTEFANIPIEIQNVMRAFKKITFSNAYMKYGALSWSTEPIGDEQAKILQRFAGVFEQTYTRFLDLQKAEAQAREAQIEAALERVRSRTMAMQHSNELAEAASILFGEVNKLGINAFASVFHIWEPDMVSTKCWANGGEGLQPPLRIPHTVEPFHHKIYDAWKRGEQYFEMVAEGAELEATYRFMHTLLNGTNVLENIENSGFNIPKKQFTHCAFFSQGYIMVNAYEKPNLLQENFIRFAKVFEQTYTRFLDLQKAEAQARESQIEAALERIRAKALAMQSSKEFLGIAQTMREQMNLLGQKELEASVIEFYNMEEKYIHSWHVMNTEGVTTDGVTIGTTKIPFNATRLTKLYVKAYQSEQVEYTILAQGDVLKEWLLYLSSISPDIKQYLNNEYPSISYYHFSKFSNGTLLMVSQVEPAEDVKYLQKRTASVFDLAYRRFLDLKLKEKLAQQAEIDLINLKEEKQKTEEALTELKSTQAQLIQAEKLASLGELTAGIAHEIQNPLNFVNNFSEVSNELIAELKVENSKIESERDKVLEEDLLNDIANNLTKINHHGKRASDIVKGMLEHSRKSTGEKEPTDINALCDEYIRLAYHGYKAKDKDFNAVFETNLDPNLPKIEIIAQDIGRVILNLINNAFYTVSEKSKIESQKSDSNYKPKVTITTQLTTNSKVLIAIKDNGSGIPETIKDKIFQPFFTTKPTGSGTGLGLSLAYDIVKVQGGELKVESTDVVGSLFVISLPI